MRCSNCTNHDLVMIQLTISEEQLAFYRCPKCNSRTWVNAEGELTKDGVLELVRSSR